MSLSSHHLAFALTSPPLVFSGSRLLKPHEEKLGTQPAREQGDVKKAGVVHGQGVC
jgi:hypothetical protein